MVHTSHAALYSVAALIVGTGLTSICGHSVDLTNIDYVGLAGAFAAMFLDMKKRWNTTPSTP